MRLRTASLLSSISIASLALALGAPCAMAQDTPPEPAAQNDGVEEVIVTATKRAKSLQKVPVSVTALSGGQIERMGASSLRDLQFSVPSFAFAGQSSNRRPDIVLRGISSATRAPGFEGSLGFFVDGVYQPFPMQWNNPILDIERLEVLYGPQDTLFGKNTIAGAVNITTRKPGKEFGGYVTAEYGDYDYYMGRAAVDLPLIDGQLYARIGGFFARRDGYIKNVFNGHHYQELNQQGGRLQLLYTPAADWEFNLSLNIYSDDQAEVQAQTIGGTYSRKDPREVNLNVDPGTQRNLYDVAFTGKHTFENGATLESITAWSAARALYTTDEDANPFYLWKTEIYDRTRNFSQEFRFTSAAGGSFDYILGGFFLYTDWLQSGCLQILPGDPYSSPGGVCSKDASGQTSFATGRHVSSNTYAAYGDFNYHFAENWTLNFGIRLSHDEKQLAYGGQPISGAGFLNLCLLGASQGGGCIIPGGAYPGFPAYVSSMSKSEATAAIGINYQLSDDVFLYGKISTGYKGGGWNTGLGRIFPPGRFNPEHVTYYEIGAKTQFFDRHLRFNIAAFYQDYRDKQETVFISITEGFRISNAASATIQGVEATATAVLGDFTLNAGIGYADPTYDNFQCQQTINCRGQQLVFAPKTTANGSIEYDHDFEGAGALSLQVQVTYRDKLYITLPNNPAASVPEVTLWNARAGFTFEGSDTEIYAFAKNLTDETYLISRVPGGPDSPGTGATASVLYGPPRFIGIGITQRF